MNPAWPLLALLAIGHLAIFALVFNMMHALGISERRTTRMTLGLLFACIASIIALAVVTVPHDWHSWSWVVRGYAVVCWAIALVGLPLVTVARALRREPDGIEENSVEVELNGEAGSESLIGSGRYAWMLRIPGNESLRLIKREWRILSPSLPSRWDGLSLVHLSDLHFSPSYRRQFFEKVADEAAAWEADFVVFTGDLVDHDECLDWIVPVMSRLRGRLGTFAILGNHDFHHDHEDVIKRLADAGFTSIEGRWTELEIDGSSLALGGTSYPWGTPIDLRAMISADYRILLSHSPDLFYRAAASGIDLMLSGHNHGGQIRFPILGPIFMPSLYSRRLDRGHFRKGPTTLHVSQGVAGKHPLRFGCMPEIGRFVLHSGRMVAPENSAPACDVVTSS
jgi:predicted MPP superfamily phosphohydrolase